MFTDNNGEFPPAWQWPGLWSVNLLVFTVLWHQLFARSFGMWFDPYHFFTTAGLAWSFVAAERWLCFFQEKPENVQLLAGDAEEQKGRMLRICLLILLGLILVAVFAARTSETVAMVLWTVTGGAYLAALQAAPKPVNEVMPREMALALYLAGTATLFIWANAAFPWMRLLLPNMLFLLLFFYYFCLVSSWSPSLLPSGALGPVLDGAGGRVYRSIPPFLVIATILLVSFNPDPALTVLFLSIGISALLLLLLDFCKRTLPKPALRIFADIAMITPLLPLAIL